MFKNETISVAKVQNESQRKLFYLKNGQRQNGVKNGGCGLGLSSQSVANESLFYFIKGKSY